GKTFDFAEVAWINDRGDVGFGAHVQGEEFVLDNVYLSKAPSFQIISIAHQGDPAPGGGTFRHAWGQSSMTIISYFCGRFNPSAGQGSISRSLSLRLQRIHRSCCASWR